MTGFLSTLIAEFTSLVGLGISLLAYRAVTKKKRYQKIEGEILLKETVKRLDARFKKEFDGNSGGSREAINNIARTQAAEVTKSEGIAYIVHRLEGAFEEHRLSHERA
jgi:hypothetical protein